MVANVRTISPVGTKLRKNCDNLQGRYLIWNKSKHTTPTKANIWRTLQTEMNLAFSDKPLWLIVGVVYSASFIFFVLADKSHSN